ncbi:hypothetical protein FRB95_014284 [Tulasnella sp. JGI-2019a]|nr:hypothetical protein FRB95_014284 [Tulasnella sp. JGI-2019a]
MIKINVTYTEKGITKQHLMSGTPDMLISDFLKSVDVGYQTIRSFTMRGSRYRICRWEADQIPLSKTPYYNVLVVDGTSDYHGKDSTLKISRRDSFAKAWTRITEPGATSAELVNGTDISFSSLRLNLQRTLRIPDDGETYPLPAGLGAFPLYNVADYSLPEDVKAKGGLFVAMYQCEAMWMSFKAVGGFRPVAVRVFAGGINGLSGQVDLATDGERPAKRRKTELETAQDYVVVPGQLWLDGFVSSDHEVKQFVAKPLNKHETVESQITGSDKLGGMQLELTPSFKTDFAVVTGADYRHLDRFDTPNTAGLAAGD